MDWATLRPALDLLLAAPGPEVQLAFYGGEPLLAFPLLREAVLYVKRRRRRSLRVWFSIVTNGLRMDAAITAFLARHGFRVYLSFDGVPPAQDLRGKGTYRILDGLLDRVRKDHSVFYRRNLRVGMTVAPPVLGSMAESVRYFMGKEVEEIDISPCETLHEGWVPDRIRELDEQVRDVFAWSRKHYRRTGAIPVSLLRRARACGPRLVPGDLMCGVGDAENLTVDADGFVYGCVAFARSFQDFNPLLDQRLSPLSLGHLHAPGLEQRREQYEATVERTALFTGRWDKFSSYGHCRDCAYLAECAICPVAIGHSAPPVNEDRVPDFLCAFNMTWTKYRRKFPIETDIITLGSGRLRPPTLMLELRSWLAAGAAEGEGAVPGRRARQ